MINWEFLSIAYPSPEWQRIGIPLGTAETFQIQTFYTKPGGEILIRQSLNLPAVTFPPISLFPDHDFFLIDLAPPAQLGEASDLERFIEFKLHPQAQLYQTGTYMIIAKIAGF